MARGPWEIVQPQFEILPEEEAEGGNSLEIGRVVPIYESIASLGPRVLRRLMWAALEGLDGQIPDRLPPAVVRKNRLLDRATAVCQTHFPPGEPDLERLCAFRTPAQVRLIFEEFFQRGRGPGVEAPQGQVGGGGGISRQGHRPPGHPQNPALSPHQRAKAGAERNCRRHVLGPPHESSAARRCGLGKTIVAIQAAILAMENGYQVALMAPTEILATQHYLYIKRLFSPLAYRVELLISARKASDKAEIKRDVAAGAVNLAIGTHALIEEDVRFAQLGLVVVDEQHRFGVLQRQELMRKGYLPDVLVMTATPIPRTLALTLYGDLDFSVIDELPPHRTPIVTKLVEVHDRENAYAFLREGAWRGEQAYVVCPVIDEGGKLDLKPAVRMYEHLARNVFPEFRVGLLHRPPRQRGEGRYDAALPARRRADAGSDHGGGGGRGCAQRHGDAHRHRRPLRPLAA